MTDPVESDLLGLATPYALNAVSVAEEVDIDRRLASARPDVAQAFAEEVRSVRETMAVLSALTAVEPPETLRDSVLATIAADPVRELHPSAPRRSRWRAVALAAAAVVVIGLGAVGIGLAIRPDGPAQTTAEQVFAAPDVQTVSGNIPGGGKATVVFSKDRDAGVLVMNDVPPPKPGTVYQMWLVGADGPHSAGVMDAKAVSPSTTAVLPNLGSSKALAFTVEPPGGSPVPTSTPFAQLLLI